jgi:exodeoxyribonuclease V gamma subunit
VFHLHYGNDLRGLARRLGERLVAPDGDPLAPTVVLIPQAGLRRWLEIELAEAFGIVANVDFRLPAEFVWQVLRANRPDLPERSAFDRDVLRWRLMPLLAELAREPVGAPVARYLAGADEAPKRLQLARELASALERYQAYRRDLLEGWERGAEPDDWQAEAWRRLVRAGAEPHRARLIGDFLARHRSGAAAPLGLPARLGVFGCLNVSPDVLRVLGTVAHYCDVEFHLPSPCREYWGDLRSVRERLRAGASPLEAPEQPLLASWGRVGREFFDQVFSYDEVQPAEESALVRMPSRAHLLGRVQADILELRTPPPGARAPADAGDVSLRVHACHSPLREVQVLHDHLLAAFERDPTLKPRDVAVMLPDVARYAPAIDAVFGALPPGDPRRIPYTVADRRAQDEHPVAEVFLKLLGLPASRWTANELLDLVAVPAVMRRLGLDEEALADLAHWLELAGIRWGLDASTRVAFGAGDYRAFTWAEGIERLLLGYAGGDERAVGGVAPVAAVEGHAATALGQALLVLRELERLAAAQRTPRRAGEWRALYQRTLDALLPAELPDRDERRALDRVRWALAALAADAEAGGCDEALDWQTVRAFLGERLAEADAHQRFLSGGVSFCGMVPLRAIPFRVIAVLGLDDEAFPRREPAGGINRLEQALRRARRLGDRSVRDDDRYLFLQILTSAEDRLHLSYVGRDARTGEAREPSALVAELLDVLERDYASDARRALVVEHPLQPFARAEFDASRADVFTYRHEWRAAATARRSGAARAFFAGEPLPASSAPAPQRIALDRLVEFWRNPSRGFLRDALHLDLYADDETVEDDDPLALGDLDAAILTRVLAERALDEGALPAQIDPVDRMRHGLPVGRAGAEAYRRAVRGAVPVAAAVEDWRRGEAASAPVSFELALDGRVVECTLRQVYAHGLLHWTPGTPRGNHWLRPWIEYLAFAAWERRAAAGFAEASCTLIAAGEAGVAGTRLAGLDAAAARALLADLLRGWDEGRRAPLAFFPKSAWTYVRTLADGGDDERALRGARADFDGGDRYGERRDPWIALAFRDRDPFADPLLLDAFRTQARRVYGALVALLRGAPS